MKRTENGPRQISATLQVAMAHTGLSQRTLYNLIATGKVDSFTIGRRRYVVWESLEAFMLGKSTKYAPRPSPAEAWRRRRRESQATPSAESGTSVPLYTSEVEPEESVKR
jgi:hypothetical protein